MHRKRNLRKSETSIAKASPTAEKNCVCGYRSAVAVLILTVAFECTTAYTQTKPPARVTQRDPQALAILQRAIAASGLPVNPTSSFDFSASGTMTYFEHQTQVSGSTTVLGRGAWQFRLDAQLPQGKRSIIVSGPRSTIEDPEGHVENVTHLRVGNLGILTFPYLGMAQAIDDPTAYIAYVGMSSIAGRPTDEVHVLRSLPYNLDDTHIRFRPVGTDYFIDDQSGLVLRVADTTHAVEISWKDYPHELDFGDYRNTNGINFPMQVSEKLYGQSVWNLQLSSARFNVGLSTSDFWQQ